MSSPPDRISEGHRAAVRLGPRRSVPLFLSVLLTALTSTAGAQEGDRERGDLRVQITGPRVLAGTTEHIEVEGLAAAVAGSEARVTLDGETVATEVDRRGRWSVLWPHRLPPGTYWIEVEIAEGERRGRQRKALVVRDAGGRLPRRPLITPPPTYGGERDESNADDFQAMPNRWLIVPPPYELTVEGGRWDPYNQNKWKGDLPINGRELFLNLTARSDTLIDSFSVPTPSAVSADRAGSQDFFGQPSQTLIQQNLMFSFDLFHGDTAFKPIDWRLKATVIGNVNYLLTEERAVVKPDVRRGVDRLTGLLALQELFFEYKLTDLSLNYDFLSMRVGVQPFNSDFRGFIFNDLNLGFRLFGSTASNRNQFNLAFFERLEKDTNSGLNRLELRDQQVAIANYYRQDLFVEGYTAQVSVHWMRDEPSFFFDRNGFLARPDPIGDFTPHEVRATYLGWAGFGHVGRLNIDHAAYYVFGDDSLNPIAGRDPVTLEPEVDISAFMLALELSYDRNWYRPRIYYFYASGDDTAEDRDAEGFDAIFDNPNFAGGGFSYWNRLGIRLAGTGVSLVSRGSLLPDPTSSKDEGQPNFVNPGVHIVGVALDLELTPKLRAVVAANHLRFDATETLEAVLFQAPIDDEIGVDLSFGLRYRPYLNNNFVVLGGVAGLLPGDGFADIYESGSALYGAFANVILTF